VSTTRDFEPPSQLRERARAWLSTPAGDRTIAAPRIASTVLLLRESEAGTEVFMQRRVSSMKFAPSMWVFPGGGVDPRDETSSVPWAGPPPREWARLMGVPEPIAQAVVIAAVREVFEECGVLLAGPSAERVVLDVSGDDWRTERAALLDHSLAFAQLLQRRGLLLRSDLLALQDHWITPELEPRRYDTWFFSALLPESQVADDHTTEADRAVWRRPSDVLAEVRDGRSRMFPPTVVQLDRIAGWSDLAPVTVSREGLVAVMPEPVDLGDTVVLRSHLND